MADGTKQTKLIDALAAAGLTLDDVKQLVAEQPAKKPEGIIHDLQEICGTLGVRLVELVEEPQAQSNSVLMPRMVPTRFVVEYPKGGQRTIQLEDGDTKDVLAQKVTDARKPRSASSSNAGA